jgi:hypothetical protein
MTLGNMRSLGVRGLAVFYLKTTEALRSTLGRVGG